MRRSKFSSHLKHVEVKFKALAILKSCKDIGLKRKMVNHPHHRHARIVKFIMFQQQKTITINRMNDVENHKFINYNLLILNFKNQ